jgi:hypothetical protein
MHSGRQIQNGHRAAPDMPGFKPACADLLSDLTAENCCLRLERKATGDAV